MTRMSHAEYLAGCDEDQLIRLVEMANSKLEQIRQTGWVKLWVVSDDCANLGWFAQDSYLQALEFLAQTGAEAAAQKKPGELGIRLEKYRPDEAGQLVKETQNQLEKTRKKKAGG